MQTLQNGLNEQKTIYIIKKLNYKKLSKLILDKHTEQTYPISIIFPWQIQDPRKSILCCCGLFKITENELSEKFKSFIRVGIICEQECILTAYPDVIEAACFSNTSEGREISLGLSMLRTLILILFLWASNIEFRNGTY